MDRALVVLDRTDAHRELLGEAAEHARGVDADLVLLSVLTEEEFEADAETLAALRSTADEAYDDDDVLAAAARGTEEFAREVLGEAWPVAGVLAEAATDDDPADVVLEVAAAQECDHVYVLGRRRSPTGKALFGDFAQRIALNFDGYVTLSTR